MKILGIEYTIKQVDWMDRLQTQMGAFDAISSEITICSRMNNDVKNSTLLHEIIHGIDNAVGTKLTEEQVEALASGLFAVCKENGIDTNWIKD